MKAAAVLLCVLLALAVVECLPKARNHQSGMRQYRRSRPASPDDAPAQWFRGQKVDHFDPQNDDTFSQRYFLNDTFWQPNGPVFMILGGEGPIKASDVNDHFVISQVAQQFNAAIISVEHRFYGETQPFDNTDTQNLRFLSSEQALADFAYFQDYFTRQYNTPNSKWVVWGGSYSGNLSAWFRLKYPHLAAGAIASSAPVIAQLDFPEYLVTVGDGLQGSSQACYNVIANATTKIEADLNAGGSAQSDIESMFQVCTPMKSMQDKRIFMESITDVIAGVIQYSGDNVSYQLYDIDGLCDVLTSGTDPVQSYANAVLQLNAFGGENCTESSYSNYVRELSNTSIADTAGRSWTYQTCTEFGYFQTGSATNQPFSSMISLELFIDICQDVFGLRIPDVDWTNTNYGADEIQSSRTVFSNGSVDPWHNLGVLSSPDATEETAWIDGGAHCSDLYPPSTSDSTSLTAARQLEVEAISRWLEV